MLEEMFSTFAVVGSKYIFPASLTLFGNENSDSKTLVLRAVEKNYPYLIEKYQRFFANSDSMPKYYQEAFGKKTRELSEKYGIRNSIIESKFL